eukprot:2099535-Lingulodinium_polyedra.AAC.1
MERASARIASRRANARSTGPRHRATFEPLHIDAAESTARQRGGLQIARSLAPRARQETGAR